MTRIERIRAMSVEEIAKAIRDYNITDDYCKSDCEWAQSMEDELLDGNECLKCCMHWLESEVEEEGQELYNVMTGKVKDED